MDANDVRNEIHAELAKAKIHHAGIGVEEGEITVSVYRKAETEAVEIILEFLGYVPSKTFQSGVSGRWTVSADRIN